MNRDESTVAIVPAYNEASTLRHVVESTARHVDDVVVIDDASEDATREIAAEAADEVLAHERNRGVGRTLYSGYEYAVENGYDLLVQIDADGQHDADYIPELLAAIRGGNDLVIGSRWLNDSHREYSLVRRAGVRFFTMEANLLCDEGVTDITSGYRGFDVSQLAKLSRPLDSHWALEQTIEASRKGLDIAEVSVPMPPETEGTQFDLRTYARYPPLMVYATVRALYLN